MPQAGKATDPHFPWLEQLEKMSPCPPLHLPWGKNPPAPGSAFTDSCSFKLQLFPPSHICSEGSEDLK